MPRKKTGSGPASWLDNAVEVPRETVAANRDRGKTLRRVRIYVRASIVLLPLALLMVFLVGAQALNGPAEAPQAAAVDSPGKSAATIALEAWLDSEVPPVAGGGRLLSWDGFDTIPRPEQTQQEAQQNPLPAWDLEVHHFSVVDAFGVIYDADVQVAVGETVGAAAIATPTLLPRAIADDSRLGSAAPWFGLSRATAPEPVNTAIRAWAEAFTSADPAALRVAVQDDNADRAYVPLYNVRDYAVAVGTAAPLPAAEEGGASTRMVVQVQLTIDWEGSEPLGEGQSRRPITYDLLVSRSNSAAPVVVAWGAPGQGPALRAFENGVSGREVLTPDGPNPNASAVPTDSPSATPIDPEDGGE